MVMRIITIKIDEETLEEIDRASHMQGLNRSQFIRRAVREYLKSLSSKRTGGPRIIVLG